MKYAIKATIKNIIVAFLIVIAFFGLIYVFLGRKIELNISLINKIAVDSGAVIVAKNDGVVSFVSGKEIRVKTATGEECFAGFISYRDMHEKLV